MSVDVAAWRGDAAPRYHRGGETGAAHRTAPPLADGRSPEELRTALGWFGFTLESVQGSHWHYRHPARSGTLTIPYHRPVLRIYVRQALRAIDEVTRDDDR